jgi:hypothetical protein
LAGRHADDALEVIREVAVIRESDARRGFGQSEALVGVQEVPRPRDPA